ncbi:hypothetical protein SEPCBS119000_002415 [Sporothrix epigloea]|uniref:Restriction of telomere capping protein 4 n=1 Tax=Sporothrix epigloea TaxID=1892477 RepID=A0ABP0DIT6_9PEZI
MNSSHRNRRAVRIAAPNSVLVRAVNGKRENKAAAVKGKRHEREPVAVDAPPLSSSDEEIETPNTSASERERQGSSQPRTQRRPGLLIAADHKKGRGSGNTSDGSSSSSQRGTKRRYSRDEEDSEESEERKAPARSVINSYGTAFSQTARPTRKATYGTSKKTYKSTTQRSVSATATTSIRPDAQRVQPVFKHHKHNVSDDSEPDEQSESDKKSKKSSHSKADTADLKSRKQAASSSRLPTPPSTARFVRPRELTSEEESPAEEAEQHEATPVKKFQHSKWAESDEEEDRKEQKVPETKTIAFQHSRWKNSDDESDASKTRPARPKAKTAAASKSKPRAKSAERAGDADEDAKTDVKAVLKSRQSWRQKLEKKKLGIRGSKDDRRTRFGQLELEKETSPPPPRAVFRMPTYESVTSHTADQDDGIHDEVDDVEADADADSASRDGPAYTGDIVCPLCKAVLDEDVLRDLLADHHLLCGIAAGRVHRVQLNLLKFDEKLRFCAGHKQRAGRATWTARGYPAIDWTALPARLPKYEAHVRKVILGTMPSPFRATWESSSFSSSSLFAPGYYGRRGLRVLSDAIVQRHAKILSRRAVEDRLLASRGMVQFVQAVLVPELAVLLIQEDLQAMGGGKRKTGSSLDEARRVLHESAALGEEVMDEERDVVEDEDEEGGTDEDGR